MKPKYRFLRGVISLFTVLTGCSVASAANVTNTWSGADAAATISTNWSDGLNWIGGAEPSVNGVAYFTNDTGLVAGPGNVDNVVNASVTIAGLAYTETNGYHNTVINPGVTLTISNNNVGIPLMAGPQVDPLPNADPTGTDYNTISGVGGTVTVVNTNVGSWLYVEYGSGTSGTSGDGVHMATLDLSGLDTFNLTVGRILIGVQGQLSAVTNQPQVLDVFYPQGTLLLAATNYIGLTQLGAVTGPSDGGNGSGQTGLGSLSGPAILIGDGADNEDTALPQAILELGQTNVIYADSITVGREKSFGTLEFNGNFSSSSVYVRGASSNRVSFLRVGDNSSFATSGSEACRGTVDLSGGMADIMLDTLIIANGQTGNGNSGDTGSLTMGVGTMNVNTVELGNQNATNAGTSSVGTLAVNSGNVVVNNKIILGNWLGGSVPTGNLHIQNGTLTVVSNGILDQSGNASSTITLASSVLSAANVGTPSGPIGHFTIGDSTLNLAVTSQSAPVVTLNLTTASSSIGNTINVTSISPIAGLASKITLIQSGTPIQGNFNANLDFALGTLPAGYHGTLQTNSSGTEVQLVLTASPYVANIWTGADLASHNDTNWSDPLNWSTGLAPNSGGPAFFTSAGAVAASALSRPGGGPAAIIPKNVNNIVDTNITVLELTYAVTNGTFQNTFVSNSGTLNITLGGLTVGSPDTDFGNTTGNVTVAGSTGTLNVSNSGSQIYVGMGHNSALSTATATLDLSGLGTFNASAANFLVGVGGYSSGSTTILQPTGIVYLAQTNTITASSPGTGANDITPVALEVGDAGDAETQAGYDNNIGSSLFLGQSNAIFADYITVGRQWGSGGMFFNPAFSNSIAYFRGASANAVSSWNIADGVQNTLIVAGGSGTNDFSGGTINALVNTLQIGKSSPNSFNPIGPMTGILTFSSGTITANTVNVSDNPAAIDGNVYNTAVGTLNVNGAGLLVVNNTLNLGLTLGPAQGSAPLATLGINGGAVWANHIVPGVNGAVSTIDINGGSLTVSNGIGSMAAPLTTLNLTNATINLGAVSFPAIAVGGLNVDGSSSTTNTVNVSSLPAIEQYPLTLTLIQSASPINLISGVFNFKAGLPGAYSGVITESGDGTAVLLTLTSGPFTARGMVFWNGPDGSDMNWSDGLNWQLPPVPGTNDIAFFDNVGASGGPGAGSPDNIVDTNLNVAGLTFAETNAYHNMIIDPGNTLTVLNTNVGMSVLVGTQSDPGSTAFDYNTISGAGGTLIVNNTNVGSAMVIQQNSSSSGTESHMATLDLSGLDTFHLTVGRLLIGVQGYTNTTGQVPLATGTLGANSLTRPSGTLILAKTNVIKLTQLGNIQGPVDAANGNGTGSASIAGPALCMDDAFGTPTPNSIQLGLTNAIFADTITVGREKSLNAVVTFNPNFSGSSLYLRGASSNRVSSFYVADDSHVSTSSTSPSGNVVDLSAGTSDIMIDTLIVANGEAGSGAASVGGTFTMGAGTLNVNTLNIGVTTAANAGGNVTGSLNVMPAGNVVVNNQLVLGLLFPGGAVPTRAKGILNIGGAVAAGAILSGGGTNAILLTNGTITLTSATGSIGNAAAPISSITLSNSTLNVAIGGSASPVVASNVITAGTSNTLNVTGLPVIGSVPTTLNLIQSINPIVGAFNWSLGTLPAGYAGNLQTNVANTAIQLVLTHAPLQATGASITNVALQFGNVVIAGSHGKTNSVYYILTSTNLALPIANWSPVATNTFDANGNFSNTLSYLTNDTQRYYVIKSQ